MYKLYCIIKLNRLTPQTESILSVEQTGFRKNRSTTEQILNCRILMEKHIAEKAPLYHIFIDFKKAFDRVWHEGLWDTMTFYVIDI